MKKMFFLPLLVAVLFGCSSDNNESETAKQAIANTEITNKALPGCMDDYTITATLHPTLQYTAVISWDTSVAIYNANTTSKIEVQPIDNCPTQSGTSLPVQTYPLPNIFSPATGSITISHLQVGKKCMKWRFVNSGRNEQGESCATKSAWFYFQLVP